jgi:hypothetical protein
VHPDVVALLENDFDEWLRDRKRRRRRADAEATFYGLYNDFCWWSALHHLPLLRPETFGALLDSAAAGALATEVKSDTLADFPLLEETPREETPFAEAPLEKGKITAEQWLADQLAAGPRATVDLRGEATMAGFSWLTVQNAKRSISATSPLPGVWALELPRKLTWPGHRELTHAELDAEVLKFA